MEHVLSYFFGILLPPLFSVALFLAVLCYRWKRERFFRLAAVYFAALLGIELLVQDRQMQGPLHVLLLSTFSVPSFPTVICYCVAAAMLTELVLLYRVKTSHVLTFACLAFLSLWFVNMLLLKDDSVFILWLNILPYQVLTFFLSAYGLCGPPPAQLSESNSAIKLLRLTALFSVLILLEDTLTAWWPPFTAAVGTIGTARNICENTLQIVYAVVFIRFSSILLLRRDRAGAGTQGFSQHSVERYAQSISLSARERDVFLLLQQGKSNQEICEALSISLGTAKAHTHNIYQKSGCENRSELMDSFGQFISGGDYLNE